MTANMNKPTGKPAKAASKIKRTLLTIGIMVAILATSICGIRIYNSHKYSAPSESSFPRYYADPADLSLYPKNLDGITVSEVHHGTAQGFHLVSNQDSLKAKRRGIIITYGGSEGTPGYENAVRFTQNGYEVLALFMFGQPNQPQTLSRIPLEQFEDALEYINEKTTSTSPITVVAASKGAEYALNLATKYPQISNLILISPSAYTFAGLDFEEYGSSWTYQGHELPFIDIKRSSLPVFLRDVITPLLAHSPITYKNIYNSAVASDQEIATKTISIKDTEARILILAGEDDCMWDSPAMAKAIQAERPANVTVQVYTDAGHLLTGRSYINAGDTVVCVGGRVQANHRAFIESNELILKTLEQWHRRS
ncbi:MAG: acyl-CoA thioester hydrolase/BAAT C-terminal domain-containing protein [Mobiluncus porci]|uniref:acyl-CoA thioester hydrolase/BAAT C-terminal domain-containing protein n=1 Tax=Mobiluncus TaxID=2050 RepID=UPI0023F24B04|nr:MULTISPECIES: acyl-CoA thioester hydrolase/BAAT C-terminal domain-containing protein [Mobiluncus]MCI6584827.1 alpha/beta hydrolase [Mobiluncus sp.]MDD7541709.1 acyl-CoA thioester hydrolase/BAAT C-terminal domain-containing protein [Mobiluncus porci]MDY5749280.1 acyl-CoA thioester hydrolase/BAAT C-terminal domain-containing protein [Mobiluncus porci]